MKQRSTKIAAVLFSIGSILLLLFSPIVLSCIYTFTATYVSLNDKTHIYTWATNGIYMGMWLVAVGTGYFIYYQIGLLEKQQRAASAIEMHKFIYDLRFDNAKKQVHHNIQLFSDRKTIESNLTKIEELDIPFLLTMYNNLSLLIIKKTVVEEDLPDMFKENAKTYYSKLKLYIDIKQKGKPAYAKHFIEYVTRK